MGRVRGLAPDQHRKPSSARCRTVSAGRWPTRCSAGRSIRPSDIARIARDVDYNSMDLLQAAHTLSGIEMALWDLLGNARGTSPSGGCWATTERSRRRPMPRCCSATAAADAASNAGRWRERASGRSNSAGVPSAAARRRRMRTSSRPPGKALGRTARCWSMRARSGTRTSRLPQRVFPHSPA